MARIDQRDRCQADMKLRWAAEVLSRAQEFNSASSSSLNTWLYICVVAVTTVGVLGRAFTVVFFTTVRRF